MAVTDQNAIQRDATITELYRQHSRWLREVIRRRGGGEASEDLVQEVYLRLAACPPGLTLRHPQAFLTKIARHLLLNGVRSAGAAKNARFADDLPIPEASIGSDQFETVLLKESVLALPAAYRDVFVLSRFGGMTYAEIAAVCQLSEKAVERRMSKALAICAARLRD